MIHVWFGNFAFIFSVFILLMSLLLTGKPKLKKLPSVMIANEYESPELVCKASGWPLPGLSWWRNGSKIRDGDYLSSFMIRRLDNGLAMKLMDIVGYHHGTYFCRAENLFGASEDYVNVMVKSK